MSTLPDNQHMARVSIGGEAWREFRAIAVLKKRSVADYLGHLVQKELDRAERVDHRRRVRRKSEEIPSDQDDEETWGSPMGALGHG